MAAKRQWMMLTALGCLAVVALGFLFLVKPEHSRAGTLHAQTAAQHQQTATLGTQLSKLQKEQAMLAAKKAQLKSLTDLLPPDPKLATLTRQLTLLATTTKVDLTSLSPGVPAAVTAAGSTSTPSAPSGVQQVPLTLAVSGSFTNLQSFFAKMETSQRALLVDGFSIAVNTASAAQPAIASGSLAGSRGAAGTAAPGSGELTVTVTARAFTTTPVVAPRATATPTATASVAS